MTTVRAKIQEKLLHPLTTASKHKYGRENTHTSCIHSCSFVYSYSWFFIHSYSWLLIHSFSYTQLQQVAHRERHDGRHGAMDGQRRRHVIRPQASGAWPVLTGR